MKLKDYYQSLRFGEKRRFADDLGIHPTTMVRIINGQRNAGAKILRNIEYVTNGAVRAYECHPVGDSNDS